MSDDCSWQFLWDLMKTMQMSGHYNLHVFNVNGKEIFMTKQKTLFHETGDQQQKCFQRKNVS